MDPRTPFDYAFDALRVLICCLLIYGLFWILFDGFEKLFTYLLNHS